MSYIRRDGGRLEWMSDRRLDGDASDREVVVLVSALKHAKGYRHTCTIRMILCRNLNKQCH